MDLKLRYRAHTPNVAAEEMDGEVVVLDFESGRYYSIRNTGATVWRLIEAGADVGTVLARLGDTPGPEGAEAVVAFIAELASEGLVVPDDGAPPASISDDLAFADAFEPPALERFDDMQDLLLLDPIHEVDETGWPNVPDK